MVTHITAPAHVAASAPEQKRAMVKSAIKDPIREKQMFFNRAVILFGAVVALLALSLIHI